MARKEITIHSDETNVYDKDGKMVGSFIGNKLVDSKGDEVKSPQLKGDSEWEMTDELIGMGYTIETIRKTIRKPKASNSGGSLSDYI